MSPEPQIRAWIPLVGTNFRDDEGEGDIRLEGLPSVAAPALSLGWRRDSGRSLALCKARA